MKLLSVILMKIVGWKKVGEMPSLEKSVLIFAPHTTYWDGFYGKLFLMQLDMGYKFLSKKEFFRFPLNIFFTLDGSIPVSKDKEFVEEVVELFKSKRILHIVLSPEGQMARTDHWKKGFYYMANKANVPIVVGYMDYKKKEMGIKGVIYNTDDVGETMRQICAMYKDVSGKYPEKFALDKRYS